VKKYLTPAVIVALVVASLFLLTRNCGLATAYKDMRNSYNELKLITDADKKLSLAHIEQLNNAIVSADETIVQLQGVIRAKSVQVSGLSRELADLRAAEPSQPELESQPLVISLRNQISKLTNMYSLSQQVITTQTAISDELRSKFDAQVTISETWKSMYDKEHALRLMSEGLVSNLEHKVKSQGLLGKVKSAVIVGAAGYVAYSILK